MTLWRPTFRGEIAYRVDEPTRFPEVLATQSPTGVLDEARGWISLGEGVGANSRNYLVWGDENGGVSFADTENGRAWRLEYGSGLAEKAELTSDWTVPPADGAGWLTPGELRERFTQVLTLEAARVLLPKPPDLSGELREDVFLVLGEGPRSRRNHLVVPFGSEIGITSRGETVPVSVDLDAPFPEMETQLLRSVKLPYPSKSYASMVAIAPNGDRVLGSWAGNEATWTVTSASDDTGGFSPPLRRPGLTSVPPIVTPRDAAETAHWLVSRTLEDKDIQPLDRARVLRAAFGARVSKALASERDSQRWKVPGFARLSAGTPRRPRRGIGT